MAKPRMSKTKGVRLSPEQEAKVDKMAQLLGLNFSDIIRQGVDALVVPKPVKKKAVANE